MTVGGGSAAWPSGPAATLGGPAATLYLVDDTSQVGEVRRAADALAAVAGLSESERGTLAVVATEVATNLARHARGGRVLLARLGAVGAGGVELLALDTAPGIANVGRAMTDGFSTAGTAGEGLGAIRRMAPEFDLYSRPGDGAGAGTALLARVWSAAGAPRHAAPPVGLRTGAVCVSLANDPACGDAWVVLPGRDQTLVAVVDGLGHGTDAAVASSEAIRLISAMADASPAELIEAAHGALRATRGAAMAVARIFPARGSVAFAGIGNISASVHTAGGSRSLASHNGTVGHMMRKVQEFSYEWSAEATLVMHSDGITSRWRIESYPGLLAHDPALAAGVLYRDAARGRDDATVLVARAHPV